MDLDGDGTEELRRKLKNRRARINHINESIVASISSRMEEVEDIKRIKDEIDTSVTDESRERTVKAQFRERFEEKDLDPDYGERLAGLLIEMAKEEQKR